MRHAEYLQHYKPEDFFFSQTQQPKILKDQMQAETKSLMIDALSAQFLFKGQIYHFLQLYADMCVLVSDVEIELCISYVGINLANVVFCKHAVSTSFPNIFMKHSYNTHLSKLNN